MFSFSFCYLEYCDKSECTIWSDYLFNVVAVMAAAHFPYRNLPIKSHSHLAP